MAGPENGLAALGVTSDGVAVYRAVLRNSGAALEVLAALLGRDPDRFTVELQPLLDLGLVRLEGDAVVAELPDVVLGEVLEREAEQLQRRQAEMETLRSAIPSFVEDHVASHAALGEVAGIEVVPREADVRVLRSLVTRSAGEMLWMRPDQWRIPTSAVMDDLVKRQVHAGRRSRALYPDEAWEHAALALRGRAEAGEGVRLTDLLESRLAVFGQEAAILPERWGTTGGSWLVVRQPAIVAALRQLFESVWRLARPVPALEAVTRGGRLEEWRDLVQQLDRGAKDEQIARALGVSLRTVRRRVAALLTELGVDSRFQAGVEAAKRGWL